MRHDEKYLLINQGFAGKTRLMPFFNRNNNEDLLEHRTDGSDAFDTLYIGCLKFPFRDTFAVNISGVV